MRYLLIALCLLSAPAVAQPSMSASEFEAYVQGKTLFFAADGRQYGVEQYLPDRRVRWSFLDGQCKDGIWYENAQQICFVYEGSPDPQCWSFFLSAEGLTAKFGNEPEGRVLYEIGSADQDMICLGPEVGV